MTALSSATVFSGRRASPPIAGLPLRSGHPLLVEIVPLAGAGQDVFMLARAVAIVTNPDVLRPPDRAMEALRALGLTPAESRLALAIGRGADLRAIAGDERIAVETARGRLKSVFAKTDTHRQAELAAFVGRIVR